MHHLSGIGIVIHRTKHLDVDHRLLVLHETEGKLMITAKGGQRFHAKLKALQQPFSLCDYHISISDHGVYGRLIGGRLIRSHHRLLESTGRFNVASQCCEVVDLLFPYRAPAESGFAVLRKTLNNLEVSDDPELEWLLFCIDLLKALGHGDNVPEIIKFLDPHDQDALVNWSHQGISPVLSEWAKDRSIHTIEQKLQELLSRPLKSKLLNV